MITPPIIRYIRCGNRPGHVRVCRPCRREVCSSFPQEPVSRRQLHLPWAARSPLHTTNMSGSAHLASHNGHGLYEADKMRARQMKMASIGPGISSIIIIACIGAVVGTMLDSLHGATDSLTSISNEFRKSAAEVAIENVVVVLAPDWEYTRRYDGGCGAAGDAHKGDHSQL